MTVSVIWARAHTHTHHRRLSRVALFNSDGVSAALFNSREIIDICMLAKNQPKGTAFTGKNNETAISAVFFYLLPGKVLIVSHFATDSRQLQTVRTIDTILPDK